MGQGKPPEDSEDNPLHSIAMFRIQQFSILGASERTSWSHPAFLAQSNLEGEFGLVKNKNKQYSTSILVQYFPSIRLNIVNLRWSTFSMLLQ
jgi:hypothetical protein